MRVVLDRNFVTRMVSIYVFAADNLVAHERDGELTFEKLLPGAEPRPTYVIDERWFNEIIREALADARKTRDRLMAMVESEWAARTEGRS